MEGDFSKAAEMYLEGAREGDVLASFNYGWCLWRGKGVDYDPKEAKSFFAFARDMEGGESCYNIAMLYLRGEGVVKDYKKCAEFMKIAAEHGCIEAQLYLGMAYTSGCMFEPDIVGISMIPSHKSEYRCDEFLLDGDVEDFEEDEARRYSAIKQDAKMAFEWFQTAARHDSSYVEDLVAKGKYLYARCYVDGLGTDFDREKSIRLMLAAKKSGSPEAINYIAENGITPEMLEGPKRRK
jgi:TPR repeat protein